MLGLLSKAAVLAASFHALMCRPLSAWLGRVVQCERGGRAAPVGCTWLGRHYHPQKACHHSPEQPQRRYSSCLPAPALAFWLWTSLTVQPAAAAAGWLSGVPAADPFNRPYLSTSLADFWRRWNAIPARKGFRSLIYDPICLAGPAERRSGSPPAWRRRLAVCAVFAASGAGHELSLVYLTHQFTGGQYLVRAARPAGRMFSALQSICSPSDTQPTVRAMLYPAALRPLIAGRWLLFFCLQGPLLGAEAWAHTPARQARLRLPRCAVLRCALTLAAVHLMAHRLLFPVLLDSGVPARLWEQLWPAGLLDGVCGASAGVTASN